MILCEKFYEHSRDLSNFEDILFETGLDFTSLGWDDYDNSLEIYGVPNEIRLNESAQKAIFDAGFGRVWLNHLDKSETYYAWDKKYYREDGRVFGLATEYRKKHK